MNNLINSVMIFFFAVSVLLSQGNDPKQKQLLEISNFRVKSITSSGVKLEFDITCIESFNGSIKKGVESLQAENISITKGQKLVKEIDMLNISENELKKVFVSIEVPTASLGFQKSYYKYYYIRKNGMSVEIIDPKNTLNMNIKEIGKDIKYLQGENTLSKIVTQNYSVNVTGKISIDGNGKGLYGNRVKLLFRNSNMPDVSYHPLLGNQKNVHYDILDEQGNYSFNFNFTGDLSNYNQIIILVSTDNSASAQVHRNDSHRQFIFTENKIQLAKIREIRI